MAGMLNIEIEGQPRIEQVIKAFDNDLDITAILDESAATIFARIRTHFLQQVDPAGLPWLPSMAALKRQQRGGGGGTLYDTGTLFKSLQLFAPDDHTRAIGTDVPYGKFHEFGTVTLPQRMFLGFGPDDIETVQQVALRRITEALAA